MESTEYNVIVEKSSKENPIQLRFSKSCCNPFLYIHPIWLIYEGKFSEKELNEIKPILRTNLDKLIIYSNETLIFRTKRYNWTYKKLSEDITSTSEKSFTIDSDSGTVNIEDKLYSTPITVISTFFIEISR